MHTVVFWLVDGRPEHVEREIADFYRDRIAQVPGVEQVFIGGPAGTPRDVVDNSYDLMSTVLFTDRAAAAAWQTHPVHDAFRQRFEGFFDRVLVYDTLE